MRTNQGIVEVAGAIDKDKMEVRLSDKLDSGVLRFTAAHELGHALLHQHIGMHRDRPLDWGRSTARPAIEIEADRFAVSFLMPEKLVRREFFLRYNCEHFEASDDLLFILGFNNFNNIQRNRRDYSRVLASKNLIKEKNMLSSLAERFCVSVEAMAIRLEEIGIV